MKELFTGKAKGLFEDWLEKEYEVDENCISIIWGYEIVETFASEHFDILPLSMQFGVIEDFAESLGYDIHYKKYMNGYFEVWIWEDETGEKMFNIVSIKSRNEARLELIKELNNLINK